MSARTYEWVVEALPEVTPERRAEIAASASDVEDHAQLEAELGVFDRVEAAPPPARAAAPRELVAAAWNLERGRHLVQSAAVLSAAGPDVVLLSEMDHGMARTGQRHTTRELAAALGHGYAYAVEFVELGLGGPEERERHAGETNARGLHGGAIVSRLPLRRAAVVRLDAGGAWLDGARGEPRVGGRIAVLASVRAGGGELALASVHLESHGDPGQRAAQLGALLEALEAWAPGAPALIGGDLNTTSLALADLADPDRLKRALEEDPERLLRPARHEPLFERAREAGFEWRICNALDEGTHRRVEPAGSRRVPLRLDWFLARGVGCADPQVIDAVDPATGEALSDHELLTVRVRPPAAPLPSRRPGLSPPGRSG